MSMRGKTYCLRKRIGIFRVILMVKQTRLLKDNTMRPSLTKLCSFHKYKTLIRSSLEMRSKSRHTRITSSSNSQRALITPFRNLYQPTFRLGWISSKYQKRVWRTNYSPLINTMMEWAWGLLKCTTNLQSKKTQQPSSRHRSLPMIPMQWQKENQRSRSVLSRVNW